MARLTFAALAALALAGPAAAGPGAEPDARARAIHQRLITMDTHLDTPASFARDGWDFARDHAADDDFTQVDLPRMAKGGLDGGFFAIYTPQGPRDAAGIRAARDFAFARAAAIRETVARNSTRMALAFRADDAARIAAEGKVIVYQSMENSYPISGDISLMSAFYRLGVRLMGPVHFRNNDLGDSSTDPKGKEWNGLSPLGWQFVAEANRLGIVLDASHASDDVLDQMIALSRTPVLLSHSGCKAIYDHPRNVDDARLLKLAAAGGVIQMNAYGDYLSKPAPNAERDAALKALMAKAGPNMTRDQRVALMRERRAILARYPGSRADFDMFMAHLLHALKLVGPEHVGIGLDWDGGGGIVGMEDVSAIPKISAALLKAGYGEKDLAAIWSGNVLRVLRAAEAKAAPVTTTADAE
ncbi:MAG: dipeptidase [Sphingomonas fennica]